jgi:sorting nexin-1/2
MTSYKLYVIRSKKIFHDEWETEVSRRYSDFDWLYKVLRKFINRFWFINMVDM